eukprot:m.20644 g.20644  ORF g.20644 m.20644 type:complete len:154 (-) comp11035_c0_seq1:255-716(-)
MMAILRPAQRPETASGFVITKPVITASRLRVVETSKHRPLRSTAAPEASTRPSVLAFKRLSEATQQRHNQRCHEATIDGTNISDDTVLFTDLIKVAYEKNQTIFDQEQPQLRRMVLQRALWRRLQAELHTTPPELHGRLSLARVSAQGVIQPF